MPVERTPVPKVTTGDKETFPFGVDFQKSLIRLICSDASFGFMAIKYLKPDYFENEVLVWAYNYIVKYQAQFNAVPPVRLLEEETKRLDSTIKPLYQLVIDSVIHADLSVEDWLRDRTLDFIKRNIFTAAFRESRTAYNTGGVSEAYDLMMAAMDELYQTAWLSPDRSWFFEEFGQRTSDRLSRDFGSDTVATGIHELDQVLGGGLSRGELGIWIAYPKCGKSTLLVNHGVQAVRRSDVNTLHAVFEGSRTLVENRYDTVFAKEAYNLVRTGRFNGDTYRRMEYDYQMYKRRLVVRGFTERWDYSVVDIHEELRELKRLYDWEPALIVVDYGDLLRARVKTDSETESQRAAFRDLKSLANRGYALWTASQAQRPKNDIDSDPHVLYSRKIADCYDKVRVADFIGSINQTKEERAANQMRLFAELYRDNEAGKIISVKSDFSRMLITVVRDPGESVLPVPVPATALGYVPPAQRRAPVS